VKATRSAIGFLERKMYASVRTKRKRVYKDSYKQHNAVKVPGKRANVFHRRGGTRRGPDGYYI